MILEYFIAGLLLLIVLLVLILLKKSINKDMENARRIGELECTLFEVVRDLRSEQNSLAHAARIERQNTSDRLSEQIDKRVARLADLTNRSLEQIRYTVDERLNESLEQKFSFVSSRLEEMHRGLGEMQSLAGGVDELKRILANVKTRGIWGEMQLASLLYDILPKSQVMENVEIRKRSGCRVEFALIIPGGSGEVSLLPIDSKFPQEDYQRLLKAREAGNKDEAVQALKQLEKRLKSEARDIREKYICPPQSTDFAVMYLSSEGLFTEAVNIPGLADFLQRNYRVCLAGPTTLTALLNSILIGLKTVAVHENTEKLWQLISGMKNDLAALSGNLEKTCKKLTEAEISTETAIKKINSISKKINDIEEININTKGTVEDEG